MSNKKPPLGTALLRDGNYIVILLGLSLSAVKENPSFMKKLSLEKPLWATVLQPHNG